MSWTAAFEQKRGVAVSDTLHMKSLANCERVRWAHILLFMLAFSAMGNGAKLLSSSDWEHAQRLAHGTSAAAEVWIREKGKHFACNSAFSTA